MALIALMGGAVFALFCWSASVGHAAAPQATETQELEATINSQISWGSANGCTQNIRTNNFGNLVPSATSNELGTFDALPYAQSSTAGSAHVWVGCVTTNTSLASVEAQGTKDMEESNGTALPLSDVAIGVTNGGSSGINGGNAGCQISASQAGAGSCTLPTGGAGDTLVTEANEGTTELNWQYQLNLPANQPVGSYTAGEVTFTATAGEPPSSGGNPT